MYNRYTKERLETVVKNSGTWREVCEAFGLNPRGGSQYHLRNRAIEMGVDFSHFIGQGWNKGRLDLKKVPIKFYLTNQKFIASHKLKVRLFTEGLKEKRCELCSNDKWFGEEIVFELDHINKNHRDNRLENLMVLCPNCHAIKTRNERKYASVV